MAKRLKTTVYAENPSGGLAKAFGPHDNVEDIPQWAKAQWGDHVYEDFDPSTVVGDVEPSAEEKVNQFRQELDSLRADNADLRAERDQLKARVAELEAAAEGTKDPETGEETGEDELDAKSYDELKALVKERGVKTDGQSKAALIEALRGQ